MLRKNLIGERFGNYQLISLLGHGGFAEVYLARHVRLNTQVAVKVLHTYLPQEGPQALNARHRPSPSCCIHTLYGCSTST